MNSLGPDIQGGLARPIYRDPRRLMFAFAGLVCVALAGIGAVVPGIPTTIFVIIAAWCFTRSCPWLEKRLLRNRLFARSMDIIDGKRPFTRQARRAVLAIMWGWGLLSAAILFASGLVWAAIGVVAALALGSVAVVRFRARSEPSPESTQTVVRASHTPPGVHQTTQRH